MDQQKVDQQQILLDRQTVDRFWRAVKSFAFSDEGGKAKMMFAGLVVLLLAMNGMNVINNYVGRDFMTAIENRNQAGFVRFAWVYVGVFASSTLISVFAKVLEDRLALLWRTHITKRAVGAYLAQGTYHRLENSGELANPDQRIAEDVRAFTATTLSFVLLVLNNSLTIMAFSGVVWSISPLLFGVAVVYAACGSYAAIWLGRPLAGLNYKQLDKDANFRSTLLHVRENAEPLLLAHREGRLSRRLLSRFDGMAENIRKTIDVNRNLGLFTGMYYWMIGLIPALVVAPSFMQGQIEFGVVTQAGMAFSMLVGALSLIITQFQSLSNFTAVISRLEDLGEAIEDKQPVAAGAAIQMSLGEQDRVAYEALTVPSPEAGKPLIKDLSVNIPFGTNVLVGGPNVAGGVALFKATAGVLGKGSGRIVRPDAEQLLFLAEKPYLPPGTLREILVPAALEAQVSDDRLERLLSELKLDSLMARVGGLHEEQDWGSVLSLAEQQLLAFIHVLLRAPRFVFLDRADTALSAAQIALVLDLLVKHSVTYITVGQDSEPQDRYDALLEIDADGAATWKPLKAPDPGAQL